MFKEKKKDKEEIIVKKAPGKGKKFSLFNKKKINSSNEFQINLSSDGDEKTNEEENFDYDGYEQQNTLQGNIPNSIDTNLNNEKTVDNNPSPAGSSGYIPNQNDYYESNPIPINNNSNNMENNVDYGDVYSEVNTESDEDVFVPEEEEENEPLDNGDERIRRLSEAYKKSRKPQNCLVVTIMIIISMVCLLFKGTVLIIGAVICFISVFGAIFKYQDRVKYSKPVLYLSIIVAIGYAFSLIFVNDVFNSSIDNVKAGDFKDKAKQFVEYIKNTEINSNKKLKCTVKGVKNEKFTLPKVDSNSYVSPFGGEIDQENSYVLVEAEFVKGKCNYTYSIYLTDGVYQIGTLYAPMKEENLEKGKVTKR